jgi:hypothetical protein
MTTSFAAGASVGATGTSVGATAGAEVGSTACAGAAAGAEVAVACGWAQPVTLVMTNVSNKTNTRVRFFMSSDLLILQYGFFACNYSY